MSELPATSTREFRPSLAIRLFVASAAAMFAVAAYFAHRANGWSWIAIALVGMAVFAVAGLLDALSCRIVLTDDELIVVENFRTRRYARSDFVKATWAKGVPASLQRESGVWLVLPNVSVGNQRLANTLKAWLRK